MRQRGQGGGGGGHLTTGVSPTLKPGASSQIASSWPNDGLDMDSSNRTERDCGTEIPLLLQNGGSGKVSGGGGGAPSSLHAAIAGNSNMPPMPANLS